MQKNVEQTLNENLFRSAQELGQRFTLQQPTKNSQGVLKENCQSPESGPEPSQAFKKKTELENGHTLTFSIQPG